MQQQIPVRDPVQSVCEILGYDPLYLACEGRVVAVVGEVQAEAALARWRSMAGGEQAALIGTVETGKTEVVLQTELGGERLLGELEDDPLPRIC
jgi:hydrogenase expression/formation protein HypE